MRKFSVNFQDITILTKILKKLFANFLKISRIMAENFENYFIIFWKISRNTSDIFDKYFSENFEKYFLKNFEYILKVSWNFLENFEEYFEKYRKLFRKFSISTPENFKKYFVKSRRILRNNSEIFQNYFLKCWESSNFLKPWKLFWKISRNISGWRIITEICEIIFEKFQKKFLKNFTQWKKFKTTTV